MRQLQHPGKPKLSVCLLKSIQMQLNNLKANKSARDKHYRISSEEFHNVHEKLPASRPIEEDVINYKDMLISPYESLNEQESMRWLITARNKISTSSTINNFRVSVINQSIKIPLRFSSRLLVYGSKFNLPKFNYRKLS